MAGNEDLFRTVKFGGYDKDEVEEGITKIKDEAQAEINRLTGVVRDRESELAKAKQRLDGKSAQVDQLECDIKDKYQSYIDNYENIGKLVFDAQVRADRIVRDAKDEKGRILESAKLEAEKYVASAQTEVDKKVDEGRKKYTAIQEEITTTVALMNQVQRQFMESCKNVHALMNSLPSNLADAYDDDDDNYLTAADALRTNGAATNAEVSSTQQLDSIAETIRKIDADEQDTQDMPRQ